MKILPKIAAKIKTKRQLRLTEMADGHQWNFNIEQSTDLQYFESFYFFKTRPVEFQLNTITSQNNKRNWKIFDVRFEEGAYLASEEYNTTICLLKASKTIPKFVIEKKSFTDK